MLSAALGACNAADSGARVGAAAATHVAAGVTGGPLRFRWINDGASALNFLSAPAPARASVGFVLEREADGRGAWAPVQALETSFCLNPCPDSGAWPGELDCGRPARLLLSVPPQALIEVRWDGQMVVEVERRDADGRTRTCTLLQPAPLGIYRLAVCAEPAAQGVAPQCAAVRFAWPVAGEAQLAKPVLRWSESLANLDP